MPRHFSEDERETIKRRLLDSAKTLFLHYGINKTTISDITDHAQVGKGTFYLFFKSKGDIFMTLYIEEWELVHTTIDQKYKGKKGQLGELILEYFYENREALLGHPILSIVYNRHTLALISDSTVTSQLEHFRQLSDTRLREIIESWIEINNIDCHTSTMVISGMMRSLSYLNYHKDEIGEDIFKEVIRELAYGIAMSSSTER